MTDPERHLQDAMRKLISDDVVDLIAAARVEARERVRALLADAMTEAMLDRACELGVPARTGGGPAARSGEVPAARAGSPAAGPPPVTAEPAAVGAGPATTADSAPEPTGLYIYCVVPADTAIPAGLEGIDSSQSPVLIRHRRLAAVVSRVPLADFDEDRLRERLANTERLERTARAHERVLDTIGKQTTLIPMRLCSVYRNRSEVIGMLTREAPALEDALEHLEGKTEWGVKVFAQRGADPQIHDTCRAIHGRLGELASAALTSPLQPPEVSGHPGQMLLNGVYLIENDQRNAFLGLVDALHDKHTSVGLELQPSGPWPAYNFVPGTIGAAW